MPPDQKANSLQQGHRVPDWHQEISERSDNLHGVKESATKTGSKDEDGLVMRTLLSNPNSQSEPTVPPGKSTIFTYYTVHGENGHYMQYS